MGADFKTISSHPQHDISISSPGEEHFATVMLFAVFDFACGSSALRVAILVLGSLRRGVPWVSSWHPKVLPCDHLQRKKPHTHTHTGIYFVVVFLWLRLSVAFVCCGCGLCAVVVCCGCVL